MFGYADRTHTRSASAMRGSKCFMQIQMADISTDKSGVGQAYLCIHVGAVHVDLCTACMDSLADFHDFRFKDTMGRRVGNHQCGKVVFVLFGFGTQVGHIDISLLITGTGDSGETGLNSRCRISTMSRSGYQHFVTVSLTYVFQISADYTKPRIFSGST